MIELVLDILIVFVLVLFIYKGIVYIFMLIFSESKEQAEKRFSNLLKGKNTFAIESDPNIQFEINENIKRIIGEKRFNQLVSLEQSTITFPLTGMETNVPIPYLYVSLYVTEDEKQVIESIIKNILNKYLLMYRLPKVIKSDWQLRSDLNMPMLVLKFATDEQSLSRLQIELAEQNKSIIIEHSDLKDDTEDEDISDE